MILFLDFETYYDHEYSLRKMTPAEYILDERFECICLGVAEGSEKPRLIDGPDVAAYLGALNPANTTTVTYNALFDNAILAWRYNFVPARMVDGLGMARALLSHSLRRFSLGSVAAHLGLDQKGDAIKDVIGHTRADIHRDKALWDRFGAYCLNDTSLLREIFVRLHPEFPSGEYAVMDAVLRCCIEPKLQLDVVLLEKHIGDIREEKAKLCAAVGADRDAISGNGSFVELLKAQGVEIEYKEGKRGQIPAIAKTDEFMTRLLEHEEPTVQCLAAARLGIKSTLEEKRSERLIVLSMLPWRDSARLIPIPLRYCGAHTWRLSGDWKINMQNLPSSRAKPSVLRRSLKAPPGHKLVVADLAQIEARLVAWFCGAQTLLEEFTQKNDPYSRLAEVIFGTAVDKTTMMGVARHIGKAGVLGCGYGMGPNRFYESVLKQSRAVLKQEQMDTLNDIWTPVLAEKSVYAYRNRYYQVRNMWSKLDGCLGTIWLGKVVGERRIGPITIGNHPGVNNYGYVRDPVGRQIRYGAPTVVDGEFWYNSGGVPNKIYGAALLENIIQFLARNLIFDTATRLRDVGLRFVHQVHDELVFCVEDEAVEASMAVIASHMRQTPGWCPGVPLDCEVHSGENYADCK
jgi:hypothetical protein